MRTCSIPGCSRKHDSNGYCGMHAQRARRGQPLDAPIQNGGTLTERFWRNVNKDGGYADFSDPLVRVTESDGECWLWVGRSSTGGYGRLGLPQGGTIAAHNFWFAREGSGVRAYEVQTDHLCRVRACVNPRHLQRVEQRDNILRGNGAAGRFARRTHCKWGHEFTPENTLWEDRGDGKFTRRRCIACKRGIRPTANYERKEAA